VKGLAIREIADRTGVAAGTIRMWEQRYGFPRPERTASGYRMYSEDDVETLRRVVAFRNRGLSVPAALERASRWAGPTDRPSIYGALAAGDRAARAHVLRKPTLLAISRAMEDETLARAAAPVVFGAFQRRRHYRPVEHRYRRLATAADAVVVFADFPVLAGGDGKPFEVPIEPDEVLGHEWAVVVDAPGYAAALVGWEQPESERDRDLLESERRFEAMWTMDPEVVRRASRASASLAGRGDPRLGEGRGELRAERPLAGEAPAPGLEALTNRIVSYMEYA
jgi:MerR family transcriptional regulator, light-induced transcriptional regulator